MKITYLAAVVSVVFAALAVASESHRPLSELPWQREALGFRMEATVLEPAYGVAEPIIAKVVITNVTKAPAVFTTNIRPELWQVRGQDQLDTPIELTRYGRFVLGELPLHGLSSRMDKETMTPGQSRTFYVPLNELADLTVQGTYTMDIGTWFQDAAGTEAILCSGPLVFKVSSWGSKATKDATLEFAKQNPTPDVARQVGELVEPAVNELGHYARDRESADLRAEARHQLEKLSELIADEMKRAPAPEAGKQ